MNELKDNSVSAKTCVQEEALKRLTSLVSQHLDRMAIWEKFIAFPYHAKISSEVTQENVFSTENTQKVRILKSIVADQPLSMGGLILIQLIQLMGYGFGLGVESASSSAFIPAAIGALLLLANIFYTSMAISTYRIFKQGCFATIQRIGLILLQIMLVVFFLFSLDLSLAFKVLVLRSLGTISIESGKFDHWAFILRIIPVLGIIAVFVAALFSPVIISTTIQLTVGALVLAITEVFSQLLARSSSSLLHSTSSLLAQFVEETFIQMNGLLYLKNLPQYSVVLSDGMKSSFIRARRPTKSSADLEFAKLDQSEVNSNNPAK